MLVVDLLILANRFFVESINYSRTIPEVLDSVWWSVNDTLETVLYWQNPMEMYFILWRANTKGNW